jgi:hypothetical protein
METVLMKFKLGYILVALLTVAASADTLELKNGSVIKGKFLGGSDAEITFQVESSEQHYNLGDIVSLKFDSDRSPRELSSRPAPSERSFSDEPGTIQHASQKSTSRVTIPAGTQISVRTIDTIDSTKNQVGDRFSASLEEPLVVDDREVVAKGANVYGRLVESKQTGTFNGRSQLRLELTGIVVNGQTVALETGEYELTGKSRGASTAKRTAGGAAVGAIIGAVAGGGKGAAIGAAAGGGLGAGSEVITKGDQVKIPSETLLEFTLGQEITIPAPRS